MASVIQGDWNDFHIRMIEEEDIPKVLEHLRKNFYRDEPLCKRLGYEDILADDFDLCVQDAIISHNLSFMVVHKPTNKVAGVRITTIVNKDDKSDFPPFKCPKSSIIINLLTKATLAADVFAKYPDINFCADFFMASVDSEFRGHGLATEMYKRALKLFNAKQIPLCKVVLTSPFTRKATAHLGFTEVSRVFLKDYKADDGTTFFPDASPDEFITCAVLKLS